MNLKNVFYDSLYLFRTETLKTITKLNEEIKKVQEIRIELLQKIENLENYLGIKWKERPRYEKEKKTIE